MMLLDAGAATKVHVTLSKDMGSARAGWRRGNETRMRLGSSRLVAGEDELGVKSTHASYLLLVLHLRPCLLKALGYIAAFLLEFPKLPAAASREGAQNSYARAMRFMCVCGTFRTHLHPTPSAEILLLESFSHA